VEQHFFCKITLGKRFAVSDVTVPSSALVHPLCVIPDYGGDRNAYIVVLPKRNWVVSLEIKLKIKQIKDIQILLIVNRKKCYLLYNYLSIALRYRSARKD